VIESPLTCASGLVETVPSTVTSTLAPLTAMETAWSEPPASETDHSAGVWGFVAAVASGALAAGLPGLLAPVVPVDAPVAPTGDVPVDA
jgi:hypothetical protein